MARLVAGWVLSWAQRYIKTDLSGLRFSLWSGDLTLTEVELDLEALRAQFFAHLPIGLSRGVIRKLTVHIPWARLLSDRVVVVVETCELTVSLRHPTAAEGREARRTATGEETASPGGAGGALSAEEQATLQSLARSLLLGISANLCVTVENVQLRLEESDLVSTLSLRRLQLRSLNEDWQPSKASQEPAGEARRVRKEVLLEDLTLCLDRVPSAAGGGARIEQPLLNRLNVRVRLQGYLAPDQLPSLPAQPLRQSKGARAHFGADAARELAHVAVEVELSHARLAISVRQAEMAAAVVRAAVTLHRKLRPTGGVPARRLTRRGSPGAGYGVEASPQFRSGAASCPRPLSCSLARPLSPSAFGSEGAWVVTPLLGAQQPADEEGARAGVQPSSAGAVEKEEADSSNEVPAPASWWGWARAVLTDAAGGDDDSQPHQLEGGAACGAASAAATAPPAGGAPAEVEFAEVSSTDTYFFTFFKK
ncbi:hypothetical protein T492DRAFT_836017 [Pavlovales sp. CCMP2436]|nr:hypothetical protein T492DRAFT_836017 [Pavlovales sp. CCMP2436]